VPNLKGWEWLIIVALILLLFGAKRLPDAARGLGRSLRIFKAETKGLAEDGATTDAATTAAAAPAPAAPASLPPATETAAAPAPAPDASDSVPTERAEG
jgi:sec-independent protein translocase protein TatA